MKHTASIALAHDGRPSEQGWRYRAVIGSVLIGALGYLAAAIWAGWNDIVSAIRNVGPVLMCALLALSLANYVLRFVRWQLYLGLMGQRVPWRYSLCSYLAGFALTTTPGKAGELVRSVLLKRRGVPYPVTVAAFLSERLSDLVAVLLLSLLGLFTVPMAGTIIAAGAALATVALVVLAGISRSSGYRWLSSPPAKIARLRDKSLEIVRQARVCNTPALFVVSALLGLAAWAAEAWAFFLILQALDTDVSVTFAMSVYAVATLAGAVSFLPGGLGGTEVVMFAGLQWAGVDAAHAAAATILSRLTTLWFAVALGMTTLLLEPLTRAERADARLRAKTTG